MFPFVPQEFRHAGKGPATTVRVTNEGSFTCMTSQMNFQATGFVILFAAARKGAGKKLLFPKVSTVMGKQSTHCDESLLTA